jgi:hypothetical protein
MKIIQYVKSLAPVYERKELIAALNQLQEELRDNTLPVAKDIQEAFANHQFRSKYIEQVRRALARHVVFQGSGIDLMVGSLENLDKSLPALEREVKRAFSFQFATTGITYDRVQILQFIESAFFYLRFFRKMMLRLVAEEAIAVGTATPMSWAKAEREWLDEGLATFAGLYQAMNQSESQLKQSLARTSTAEVSEDTYDVAVSSIGMTKLDPLKLSNFSATQFNPFFSLGKAIAEWKVKRYQAAKEEHQGLQLRLQELRELRSEGRASAKLQKLIQHTEQRIEQLDYKLTKIEEANRLDD